MYDLASAQRADVIGDQLVGRKNVLRVPVLNAGTLTYDGDLAVFLAEAGASAADAAVGALLFSDGTSFSDGSAFALPAPDPVTVVAAAREGQSFFAVTGFLGRNLSVGSYFSIFDFLYRVERNEDGRLVFNPPLRGAVAAGEEVEVSRPFVQLRLSSDGGWTPVTDFQAWSETFSVDMEEVFER
jgi:hypothetical protein